TGFGYVVGLGVATILGLAALRAITQRDATELIGSSTCLLIAAVSYTSFFHRYVPPAPIPCTGADQRPLYEYFEFVILMPAKFIGASYLQTPTLAVTTGLVLFAVSVYILALNLVRYWQCGSTVNLALGFLILFPIGFDALTAVGRTCSGLHA